MSSQPIRGPDGRFVPGHPPLPGGGHPRTHGASLLKRGTDFPLTIDFGGITAQQGAQHFMIAANFAEEIVEMLARRESPQISKSIALYAECQARLANLANTLLGGGAKPAEWGDLQEYEEAMASIERSLSRIASVLRMNREWLMEQGSVFEGDTPNIRRAVRSDFGSILKKFVSVGLLWARGWAWVDTRKRPAHLPDQIAAIVEGTKVG